MHVCQKGIARAGDRRGHEKHGPFRPVSVLAGEVSFQVGTTRQYKGCKGGTHQPMICSTGVLVRATGHGLGIGNRNVGRNFGASQAEMREIAMRLRPFIGNDDTDIRRRWCYSHEPKLPNDLGDFLEFSGQGLVLPIPGSHAPSGLLRSTQIRHFVKLLR